MLTVGRLPKKDLNEEYRIVESATFASVLANLLITGKKVTEWCGWLEAKGDVVSEEMLAGVDWSHDQWFKIRMAE